MQEDLKNFITKLIRDEVLGVKESIKQDMDRRNEVAAAIMATEASKNNLQIVKAINEVTEKLTNQIKDLVKEEIKPMQKQIADNSEEIKFAKRLGYIFAAFVVWAADIASKLKFW